MLALSAVVLFGVLGLALDIGHVFIAKNEAQTYTDAAAVAAALRLDGTRDGIRNATTEVTDSSSTANKNRWNLAMVTFPAGQTQVEFGATKNGPWIDSVTAQDASAGLAYARVTTGVVMPMYILPVLVSSTSMNVNAASIAGQVPAKPIAFPFTPMAHDPNDKINFGLSVGNDYTFRWGAGFKKGCSGDQGADPNGSPGDTWSDTARIRGGGPADIRGFWGQGGSASIIRQQIIDDYPLPPVAVGQPLPLNGGDKNTEGDALGTRINQDSVTGPVNVVDPADPLRNYRGNGRRLVVMPVTDPHNNNIVLGYRAFLLLRDNQYVGGGGSDYCATYIGSYNEGSSTTAAIPGNSYKTRIVE